MLDDTFNISVMCDATQEIKAWELEIRYNPHYIQILNHTWGDIWKQYPDVFYSPVIFNVDGNLTRMYAVLLGDGMQLKKSGSLVTLSFITDANGLSNIEIVNIHLYNSTSEIPIEVTNGTIFISG
jgi:hypothetical protein